MKRFFIKLSTFLAFPVLLFIIAELIIYGYTDEILSEASIEDAYIQEIYHYAWVSQIHSDKLTVLSGSSSVKYGLSCNVLNNLSSNTHVNIATNAGDPVRTYFLLKSMDLKNICQVYFGLDPWIYTKRYYKHRINYMYIDFSFKQVYLYSKEHDRSAFLKRYKALLEYLLSFHHLGLPSKNLTVPSGLGSGELDRKATNFNISPKEWFQIEKYGWSDIQFKYLKKISELCKRRKWKFAVFVPPKRIDYVSKYQKDCLEIHNDYLDQLVKNNFDAPIFGVFNEINDFDAFSEAFHLNRNGQKEYSKIFYGLTQQPIPQFSKSYNWFKK